MNKKIIIGVVSVVVVVSVVLAIIFLMPGPAIDKVIPDDPLFYVKVSDTAANYKKIIGSEIWQDISKIDYAKFSAKGSQDEKLATFLKAGKKLLAHPLTKEITDKVLSKEIALAVYDIDFDFTQLKNLPPSQIPRAMEKVFSKFFLVTRVKPEVKLVDQLSSTFQGGKSPIVFESKDFKDKKIYSLSFVGLTGGKVYFTIIKDLLIMSLGEEAIQNSIEISRKEKPSLSSDRKYSKAMSKTLADRDLLVYLNLEGLKPFYKTIVNGMGKTDVPQNPILFQNIEGYEDFILSLSLDKNVRIRGDLLVDKIKLSKVASRFFSCPSRTNKSVEFVPKDPLGYFWASCFDIKGQWDTVKQELKAMSEGSDRTAQEKIDTLEQRIGFSIEKDLIPAFSDEIGSYIIDIDTKGMFPVPKIVFFLKVKSLDKAQYVMKSLMDRSFLRPQETDYLGTKITYLASPVGDMLQPSYCIIDNFMIVGYNIKVLEQAIDIYKGKKESVLKSVAFNKIGYDAKEKDTMMSFLNLKLLTSRLSGLIEWTKKQFDAHQEKQDAFKSGSEKRLQDLQSQIDKSVKAYNKMQARLTEINKQIDQANQQGQPVDSLDVEKTELEKLVELKQQELDSYLQEREELQKIINGYGPEVSKEEREAVINELIRPTLDAISKAGFVGSRSVIKDDYMQFDIYFTNQD